MRHDWSRLKVLGECNPGFQAGRATANAILPVRTIAAEYCVATKTEMAVLLDDLKRCFDTPRSRSSNSLSCASAFLPSTPPFSTTSATTDGRIHTAAGDQSRGWCAPPMVEEADSGSWSPDPAAPAPCFSPTSRRTGADDDGAAADFDDDATDLTGGPTGPASDSQLRSA